jgi:hypothetical protein
VTNALEQPTIDLPVTKTFSSPSTDPKQENLPMALPKEINASRNTCVLAQPERHKRADAI